MTGRVGLPSMTVSSSASADAGQLDTLRRSAAKLAVERVVVAADVVQPRAERLAVDLEEAVVLSSAP